MKDSKDIPDSTNYFLAAIAFGQASPAVCSSIHGSTDLNPASGTIAKIRVGESNANQTRNPLTINDIFHKKIITFLHAETECPDFFLYRRFFFVGWAGGCSTPAAESFKRRS
jgi:hypothetical protein